MIIIKSRKSRVITSIDINGNDNISGNISEIDKNIVKHCEIKLFLTDSNVLKKKVVADQNGNFKINSINLKKFKFFIVVHHPKALFNGVIADNIGGENVDG